MHLLRDTTRLLSWTDLATHCLGCLTAIGFRTRLGTPAQGRASQKGATRTDRDRAVFGCTIAGVPSLSGRTDPNVNTSSIMAEIDAEIARLKTARNLLAGIESSGVPGGRVKARAGGQTRSSPKRKLSAEARERIRQAQIKRWAALKGAASAKVPKKQSASAGSRSRTAKSRTQRKQGAASGPGEKPSTGAER